MTVTNILRREFLATATLYNLVLVKDKKLCMVFNGTRLVVSSFVNAHQQHVSHQLLLLLLLGGHHAHDSKLIP